MEGGGGGAPGGGGGDFGGGGGGGVFRGFKTNHEMSEGGSFLMVICVS